MNKEKAVWHLTEVVRGKNLALTAERNHVGLLRRHRDDLNSFVLHLSMRLSTPEPEVKP